MGICIVIYVFTVKLELVNNSSDPEPPAGVDSMGIQVHFAEYIGIDFFKNLSDQLNGVSGLINAQYYKTKSENKVIIKQTLT